MPKHRIKIALIFMLLSFPAWTQSLQMKSLGIEEGMSSNYIKKIAQDKKKFIWFATDYGLNRFDGTKFTTYMNDLQEGIPHSNEINGIATDTIDNTVWVSIRWAGVSVFDCHTETFTSHTFNGDNPHSISSNDVTDMFVTPNGDVWLTTYDTGLNCYNKQNKQFEHYNQHTVPELASNCMISISEGRFDNKIYIGHDGYGLTIFSPKDLTVQNYRHDKDNAASLPHNTVHCVYTDDNGNIWVGTGSGLSLFNPSSGKFRNFNTLKNAPSTIASQTIHSICQTKDGTIWVGTLSDLCYFKATNTNDLFDCKIPINHTYIKDINTGLSNPSVLSVFQDSFNNIWIGSNGGGARFISHVEPFLHNWRDASVPDTENGLSDKDACTICVDKDGNLWIGTDGGGINMYEKGINKKIYKYANSQISSDAIMSTLKDSKNNLWFGNTSTGIDIYDGKGSFTHYIPQTGSLSIYCLFEDSNHNVWIGTGGGIQSYNLRTKEVKVLNKKNSELLGNQIRAICQDVNGNIWIGTMNRGISIYNPDQKTITNLHTGNSFFCDMIKYFFKDSRNRMWVATTNGLAVFPAGNTVDYTIYNTQNGLACNYLRAIEEDRKGNIWVSTNFGISCFVEKENRFLNYDYTDGVPVGNFMNGSVAKTADGTIYFGSQNGVCYFNPDHRPDSVKLPQVIFTEFKIHGKQTHLNSGDLLLPVSSQEAISLHYDQNIFSISFNVMDYARQGQIEYSYKLEGLNDIWFNLDNQNQVSFRNIPYRSYTLKIKARLKNQDWPGSYSSLPIHIHPPFWLTWWAKCLYLLIVFTIILFIVLSYKRRLKLRNSLLLEKENIRIQKELNEERLRFYTNITHELRTPLTLILGPLEDLQNDTQLSGQQAKKVSLIHQSATRLLNLVMQILEFRKAETQNRKLCVYRGNLADIIYETGVKYKELNRNSRIDFSILIETDKAELYFDPEVITIIVDNLLSNAFKYTSEGSIVLSVRTIIESEMEYTEIEISDTGNGISDEEQMRIFERYYQVDKKKNTSGFGIGLALVNNLVKLHQGNICVKSRPNKGTSFRVRLLTQNTYPNAIHANPEKGMEMDDDIINKPIVLVVEDDNSIRDYIASSLIDYYDVIVAENGQKGVELAFASIPDIVISDIIMPIKDGIKLCKELKEDVRTSHIPIILLTAKDTLQDKTEGYNAGADSYVTKPFSATLLRSRVINLLDARKKMATLLSSNISLKQSIIKESLNKLDNEFLDKIIKYIEDNLADEKVDNASIINQVGMSYSTVYRKIKAITGMSINEFTRKIKMQKAEKLLLSGKYTISEICYQVGFNSISHFRECFKEEYGYSPSEYLKRVKEGK